MSSIRPETGQNLTSTLADYLVATACELPNFEIVPMHTPNRRTPAGIKGMAEGGVMGAIGAVTNAVNDALAPFNVIVERQPLSPQTIRELLPVCARARLRLAFLRRNKALLRLDFLDVTRPVEWRRVAGPRLCGAAEAHGTSLQDRRGLMNQISRI